MNRYYFLTTLLPDLIIGKTPDLNSSELEFYLRLNLSSADLQQITTLRRLVDIDNIRHMLQGEPLSKGGNFPASDLEEMLLHQEGLPQYILDFFNTYLSQQERLANFSKLHHAFFTEEIKNSTGFIKDYLTVEREWRLLFTALRAVRLNRDLKIEFRDEHPEDPFLVGLFEQSSTLSIPEVYEELATLFEKYSDKPFQLYQMLAEWRFRKVDEMAGSHTFYVHRIFAYVVQLEICEKWLELDKARGLQIIETTVKGIS